MPDAEMVSGGNGEICNDSIEQDGCDGKFREVRMTDIEFSVEEGAGYTTWVGVSNGIST